MRLKIVHVSEYRYSADVFLEPHYLRFKPKNTPWSRLESFEITIQPEPAGLTEIFDQENNLIHLCWFEDLQKSLTIEAHSEVVLQDYNPFNFIIYPEEFLTLPFEYPPNLKNILEPALETQPISTTIIQYVEQIKKGSIGNIVDFIIELNRKISSDFTLESRETGAPHDPDTTFELQKGSCRDLTWFQIHILRYYGIAARYVSGYYFLNAEEPEFELHAWTEAFIPGVGWMGFDPGHGLVAGASHLPVACSAYYNHTMPVTGFVRGDAKSKLKTEVSIHIVS